jgi:hypothetical protein
MISETLSSGFIISVVLIFFFSQFLKIEKNKVQNIISIFFAIGLTLYYPLFFFKSVTEFIRAEYSGVEAHQYVFSDVSIELFIFLMMMPIITIFINIKKSWRVNYIVVGLSCFMFVPRFLCSFSTRRIKMI